MKRKIIENISKHDKRKKVKKNNKKKYWIHAAINTIKRKFLKKINNRHLNISNRDDFDVITGQKIKTISVDGLLKIELNNGNKWCGLCIICKMDL